MPTVSLHAPSARYLCFAEREDIALLRAEGKGVREIAREIGRSPSTISRELRRNAATRSGRMDYRASVAQWHAEQRAKRPKPAKLAVNDRLREYVAGASGRTGAPARRRVGARTRHQGMGRAQQAPSSGPPVGERLEPGTDLGPPGAGLPR